MRTENIINEIYTHFTETYKNASKFPVLDSKLWEFCIKTIKNPKTMGQIVFANELEVPPVRSMLLIMKNEKFLDEEFEFTGQQSQWLGALLAFVFKNVLGYKNQKERCKVGCNGIRTATRFLDGQYVEFE